ncbi:glycosyltransferase family 4 protein [Laccaria amethystina LaAM-08-1]|uniref:Alpha-1,3/1,6-mannosyltransferase ALG2 n=1 Tax=Laccaria amethystina LaAM-08-1 TaxID=1095629 RepID=A0A0C9XQR0_9AGAR|nr:glycosyltransferase family 4 protein [Laccaria amethystina LaAM-08-1]
MPAPQQRLRVAFIHPDLGIGGAERLVVDAAIGLQDLGHSVDIYTSHHDPGHCFEETRDGRLRVHYVVPPVPRSLGGKFHILFAHARQLHLTAHLLRPGAPTYDVYFVDQLSTCVPFLRAVGHTRVVFYCHFPDKLLANGAFIEGNLVKKRVGLLKRLYRLPMDWLEEITTSQADIILANSKFTARIFKIYFPSIPENPGVVYPGINISTYDAPFNDSDEDIVSITSHRQTLLSLNRFEGKKNIALALEAFAILKAKRPELTDLRLVIAGGYDPRLEDNDRVLMQLQSITNTHALTWNVVSPSKLPFKTSRSNPNPDVLFLLNFTTAQRTALLRSPSTIALLYTPANEHFGIVPVEAMACGLPVLACDSGGPIETIVNSPEDEFTGWLKTPEADVWADALTEILDLSPEDREALGRRARKRAEDMFSMDAMARGLEEALKEAVGMGPVDVWGAWRTLAIMLIGFFIARWLSPLFLPPK